MGGAGGSMLAVFGARGAIGSEVVRRTLDEGLSVLAIGRSAEQPRSEHPALSHVAWSISRPDAGWEKVSPQSVSAVVWAQGVNMNDTIESFVLEEHLRVYEANVAFILVSLRAMLDRNLIADGARLCVVSSIWQEVARPNKLSYMVSKSALKGLIQSLALDLGSRGILVNGVLPGATDTPMTRANLSQAQVDKLEGMSAVAGLPSLDDVCDAVSYLCSARNRSVTGQFIAVDKGFSYAKML